MPFRLARFPSSYAPFHQRREAEEHESVSLWPSRLSKMPLLSASLLQISAFAVLVLSSIAYRSYLTQPKSSSTAAGAGAAMCATYDQPNPIANIYPNNATGVLNATLVVIPIPLAAARDIIPPQWGILEGAYRALLPDFPDGMYPMLVQAGHDHDIQFASYGISVPDFMRAGLEFPFLDFLGDGHSSFRWHPYQLIEAANDIAVSGSRDYGTTVFPATFDPPCNAHRVVAPPPPSSHGHGHGHGGRHHPNSNSNSSDESTFYFRGAAASDPSTFMELHFRPADASPYPLSFFRNVTNQPSFSNGSTCDNQIRLFGTDLSRGRFEPVAVRGRVRANMPPLAGSRLLQQQQQQQGTGMGGDATDTGEVFGVQVATPFIENNYLPCEMFKGFEGVDLPGYEI